MGTMAGSSVLLLTACWGSAVLAGRTELSEDVSPGMGWVAMAGS